MVRLRRLLPSIASAWLICQAATLTVAAVALLPGAQGCLEACTWTNGDHSACPLHHLAAPVSALCQLRNAQDPGAVLFRSVLGTIGVLPEVERTAPPHRGRARFVIRSAAASALQLPPEPPPRS